MEHTAESHLLIMHSVLHAKGNKYVGGSLSQNSMATITAVSCNCVVLESSFLKTTTQVHACVNPS